MLGVFPSQKSFDKVPAMALRRKGQDRIKLLTVITLIFVVLYLYGIPSLPPTRPESRRKPGWQDRSTPRGAASNSTLGFQKILALSKGPSWRSRGLLAAAGHSSVNVEIPRQPHITSEMIDAFRHIGVKGESQMPHGSAHAWLAHLDLIKYGVSSGLDTFMIVEDDVDWDVSVKGQMALISDNVRKFLEVTKSDSSPYGRSWDVLWLGHCGEHTDVDTPRVEFADSTVPLAANYTGWADKYLKLLKPGNRAIQRAINPVCSFGYALTAHGAQRVLDWAGKGGSEAYDIKLMLGCKLNQLDCITVTPEIMHHYTPSKALGYHSLVQAENGKGASVAEETYETTMGATENIRQSARCRVLFDSTCVKKQRDYF
ncbi:hypothetical protein BJ875DRAFT_472052 [Amylocarpus encephaloides]|uniref:Glycosyltransferase family 25 protein n=1 Tax=Amylocarpus encephaloides TaxID=45428 RepID=A0A9P7YBQ6_9HELO|nr:hypothetical protein BJ875DRAFT_472052 [Amylocarpus encephaloides]